MLDIDYVNLKRYLSKGKRVALFGKNLHDGNIQITQIVCSKRDAFSKDKAYRVYELLQEGKTPVLHGILFHPVIFVIPGSRKKDFLNYCSENYYHREPITVITGYHYKTH